MAIDTSKNMPLIGCNTCRRFVATDGISHWYNPARRCWTYRISCHGQQYEEERMLPPAKDSEPIRVGTWSPMFNCQKCGETGIHWERLRRDWPIQGRTTFQIHHHGELFCEMFITSALEAESDLRAQGRATPTLDNVDLTNYQDITPFEPDAPLPGVQAAPAGPLVWPTQHQMEHADHGGPWLKGQGIPIEHRLGPFDLRERQTDGPGNALIEVFLYGVKYRWSHDHARYIEQGTRTLAEFHEMLTIHPPKSAPSAKVTLNGKTIPTAPGAPISYTTANGDVLTLLGDGKVDVKPGKGMQSLLDKLAKATGQTAVTPVLPKDAMPIYRALPRRVRPRPAE